MTRYLPTSSDASLVFTSTLLISFFLLPVSPVKLCPHALPLSSTPPPPSPRFAYRGKMEWTLQESCLFLKLQTAYRIAKLNPDCVQNCQTCLPSFLQYGILLICLSSAVSRHRFLGGPSGCRTLKVANDTNLTVDPPIDLHSFASFSCSQHFDRVGVAVMYISSPRPVSLCKSLLLLLFQSEPNVCLWCGGLCFLVAILLRFTGVNDEESLYALFWSPPPTSPPPPSPATSLVSIGNKV